MTTIKLGGKERPFNFSMYAIDAYCKMKGLTLQEFYIHANDIMTGKDVESIGDVIYCGLVGGALRTHTEVNFTRTDIADMMDDEGIVGVSQLLKVFADSVGDKKKRDAKETGEEITLPLLLAQASRSGLAYNDFWNCELWELAAWMDGYKYRQEDNWRHTREIMAAVYNSVGAKVKGRDIIELESDMDAERSRNEGAGTTIPDIDERWRIKERLHGKHFVKTTPGEINRL